MEAPSETLRRGASYWWAGYARMVRWELIDVRSYAAIAVGIQLVIGGGFVFGISLFFEEMPARSAAYLTTGAFVVSLITVALVVSPQMIAGQKLAQTFDFRWSLPLPRTASTLAWFTVAFAIGLPGALLALLVGGLLYDVPFDVSPMIVVAVPVVLLTAGLIGYGMALSVPPMVAQLLSTTLVFVILGFAPINFPPENLPAWLAELNRWLPFYPMAVVIRSALIPGDNGNAVQAYAVLAGWWALATWATARVLGRRG
jgi:ABC-2 type transport system permease protein